MLLMEQDRWVEESNAGRNNHIKTIIALGVLVIAIIVLSIFSCGETKVKSLSLDKEQSTIKVDETDMLYETVEPKDAHPILLWRSSDESIATVSNGLVTGRKGGKVTIIVTVKDQEEISAKCEYVIEEQAIDIETIDILEEPIILRPGGHQQMKVRVTPENQNENILWSSSDESVVRVNPRGKVEAIKVGVAYIIAESERTGATDTALVSVEGAGVIPNMTSAQTESSTASPTVVPTAPKSAPASKATQASASSPKSVQVAKPASKPSSVPVAKQTTVSKPSQTTVTKVTPSTVTKTPVKVTPVQTVKTVTKAPAKSSSSGLKSLGYANFRGSWPNDVNGRMEFTSTHVIDSKDPKGRMASPGDYVIGEWSDGHLVQGIWYGSDNQVKGSILIGK